MATTKKGTRSKAVKAVPAKAVAKSRRVFPVGQCHHRDASGSPDCKLQIVAKRANLCPAHEKVWQKAARARYAANRAVAQTPATKAPRTSRKATAQPAADTVEQTQPVATAPEDLEAALAASNAAFATPELAAKAREKRNAQRGR